MKKLQRVCKTKKSFSPPIYFLGGKGWKRQETQGKTPVETVESFVEMVKPGENLYTNSIKSGKFEHKTFVFHKGPVEKVLKSGKIFFFANFQEKVDFLAEKPEKGRQKTSISERNRTYEIFGWGI